MKQLLTMLPFFITGFVALAQVGIGTMNPQAALDITSDKGLLIPRMSDHTALIPMDGTLDANEEGLQVYNTTTSTIMLWDGGKWESLNSSSLQSTYLYAKNNNQVDLTPSTIITGFNTVESSGGLSIDGNGEILLKAGITYDLEAALKLYWLSSATPFITYTWRDENGNSIGNTATALSIARTNTDSNQPTAKVIYTPTVDIKVSLYCVSEDGEGILDSNSSYISVKAIAGRLPVSPVIASQYESGEQVFNGLADGYNAITAAPLVWQDMFTFTIPSAGTWRLTYPAMSNAAANTLVSVAIKRASGSIVPNSSLLLGYLFSEAIYASSTGAVEVTTTGAETMTFVAFRHTENIANIYSKGDVYGVTKVIWEKVAGYLPVTEEKYFTEVSYTATPFSLVGSWASQTVPYNSVDENIGSAGSWFNTSTHRFTPQKAGWWKINASFDIYRGAGAQTGMSILKNGGTISQAMGFDLIKSSTLKEVYLNGTTDYIEVITYGSGGTNRNQDSAYSFFQARLIGD